MKLGFIDGTFPRLAVGSTNFEQWRLVDLMVTSWQWNSISKEIVESFMYVTSSQELWLEIQGRYGRSNGPMIYQIQHKISSIAQLDLSLTAYITKLKKYWKEQLTFDNERSQVLMEDPLPTMERVFFMLFTVEKQRQIKTEAATPHHMAYHFKSKDKRRDGGDRFQNKRRPYVDKSNLTYTHCHRTGHAMDTCFQIYGVPDWYKTLGDKRKKVVSAKSFAAAAIAEKPTSTDTSDTNQLTEIMADLIKCFWTFRD
ncbi:UNVERIFIED_CONTAM: hypothetical protein Sindi_2676600 [Sesamum indicum]